MVETRRGALETAGAWRGSNTIWTNRLRLDNGNVGAACAWRTTEGWTGRRFHLGNKEVFDAEIHAIHQALSIMGQRQETGRRYTVFADSTAAIGGIRSDIIGPGQRFAVAAIEVGTRLMSRGNDVAIHWVPAHHMVQGNVTADEMAKAAAEGSSPGDGVLDELRWETKPSNL